MLRHPPQQYVQLHGSGVEKIGGDNLEFIMGSGEWRNYTDKIVIAESSAVFAVNIIKKL